jgi:hypothetical protein
VLIHAGLVFNQSHNPPINIALAKRTEVRILTQGLGFPLSRANSYTSRLLILNIALTS